MRSIKKLKSKGKAVAGSALLVGATLTGAAGLASASQHTGDSGDMDLGDYPAPFVNSDGEVDTTIVVGEQARTADVVGAIDIAGSLGNAAFMEEEVSVDVSGATASWSAENGVTLDRQNSPIFFPESTDTEETRFDEQDLDVLQTETFQSEGSTEVEVEHDLRVGSQAQDFGKPGDLDDPVLFVKNPTNPSVDGDYLLQAEADMDEVVDFTSQDEGSIDGSADVALEDGDELRLFGQSFTYSSETQSDELVLYGSSQTFEVDTGSEDTVTIDGEEHTFQADYVTDSGTQEATVVVDGETRSLQDGDTVSVSGQEVRVTEIYRTGPDGQGRVEFSVGSEEVRITDGEVEVNDETVDGVDVRVEYADNDNDFAAVEGFTFAFGAQDSDEDYVATGESYETPLFGMEFHYGGLAPNAAEDPASTIEVDAQEDADIEFTGNFDGEEASFQIAEYDDGSFEFGPEDGTIAQYEGQFVGEDDYVVLNANEEAGLYEVTDVDNTDLDDGDSDGSVSVDMTNVVTGNSVTVEEDGVDFSESDNLNDAGNYVLESESLGGNDFDVEFDSSNDEVSVVRSTADGDRQLWPWMYEDSGATVAFDAVGSTVDLSNVFDVTESEFSASADQTVEADSTGTDPESVSVSGTPDITGITVEGTDETGSSYTLNAGESQGAVSVSLSSGDATVDLGTDTGATVSSITVDSSTGAGTHTVSTTGTFAASTTNNIVVGDVVRQADLPSGVASNDADADVTFTSTTGDGSLDDSTIENFVQYRGYVVDEGSGLVDLNRPTEGSEAGVLVTQPENDDDEEEAYVLEASNDENSASVDVADYTGDGRNPQTLDDEDVDVAYDEYGAYTMDDYESDDQETFTLNMPSAQSTSGMAVTGQEGGLSASGSTSGAATTATPTGWPGAATLDSEVSGSDRDQNMILVGGPAVNTLTEELASENKTWTADEYEEDTWVLDLVEGFSSDTHALVVAGYGAEDTQAASSYISNYADNQDELAGESRVSMTTSATQ